MFRGTVTDKADRSYMNICFVMNDEYKDLEADFLKFATEKVWWVLRDTVL